MKKFHFCPPISFVMILCLLSGCGGEETLNSQDSRVSVKKIKFLHIWSECTSQFTKLTNDFMAANPDVRVETIVSNYTDVPAYLNSQILSSSVPDVFFYWSNQVSGYAKNGVCLPLDEYMPSWSDTFVNDGEAWDLAKIGGKHYSVPFRCTGDVLVYNKTIFTQYGINVPTTIQEFEDTLVSLRKLNTNAAFAPIALTGIASGTLPQFYTAFQNFSELLLGIYQDPNYGKGLLTDSEENRIREGKMLDKLKDWNQKGYFGQCEGKTKETSIRNFMESNAAMILLNNNNLYLLDDMEGADLGFIGIPAPKGTNYHYISSDFDGFSVYSHSKAPEAAVRFLKYLTAKTQAQYFATETDSIMAVDGMDYSTPRNQEIADAMKDCGKSIFVKNDTAYSTSNIQTKNVESLVNYVLGKSGSTGKEVADLIWSRYVEAMAESSLAPVEASIPLNENADFSWLDIRN